MEKEFVTIDLALRLKALGFKERVLTYYEDGKAKLHTDIEGWDFNNSFLTCVSRPTYSQAFGFIREKYLIGHDIMCPFISYQGKKAEIISEGRYEVFLTDEEQLGITDEEFYSMTYNEAEIKCLNLLLRIAESKIE